MIKIEDVEVMGMRKAIKAMRNAMDSWEKSDSYVESCLEYIADCKSCPYHNYRLECNKNTRFFIGKEDMGLAKSLIKSGKSHRKYMRMIHVQADVIAPLYWWKQYDTYKVGTTSSSCSTMHTIHKEELTRADFSYDHIPLGSDNFILNNGTFDFENEPMFFPLNREEGYWLNAEDILDFTIKALNHYREMYLKTKDKRYWWQMIQLLPSSFNQMRTIDLSYETLISIYFERKNHKLDEWREFCKWIEGLPYMKEFLSLDTNQNLEDIE